jgi:ATP-dependent RNA helicase DeaD
VLKLLHTMGFERTIIFCNTKIMCQRLCDDLRRAGVDADCIHGDIRQVTREKTMRTFKDGKLAVLIATDVASRGIDVDDVDCVLNYDVPEENEYYIHRIGRTGRAGKKGVAITVLGTFPESAKLDEIAKYSHYKIQPVRFLSDGTLVAEEEKKPKPKPRRRFR